MRREPKNGFGFCTRALPGDGVARLRVLRPGWNAPHTLTSRAAGRRHAPLRARAESKRQYKTLHNLYTRLRHASHAAAGWSATRRLLEANLHKNDLRIHTLATVLSLSLATALDPNASKRFLQRPHVTQRWQLSRCTLHSRCDISICSCKCSEDLARTPVSTRHRPLRSYRPYRPSSPSRSCQALVLVQQMAGCCYRQSQRS